MKQHIPVETKLRRRSLSNTSEKRTTLRSDAMAPSQNAQNSAQKSSLHSTSQQPNGCLSTTRTNICSCFFKFLNVKRTIKKNLLMQSRVSTYFLFAFPCNYRHVPQQWLESETGTCDTTALSGTIILWSVRRFGNSVSVAVVCGIKKSVVAAYYHT